MSFFHNIRNTLSRGKSSSRDTTPARSSRPSSIISGSTLGRRDSLDSRADSLSLNRGDTFILGDELANSATNSNSSTLEKKSKKSKVFGKFSTFTKRKKTPSQTTPSPEMQASYEHHPSDNATNTYYNWQKDSSLGLDYDAQSDPFHFLYDKQATLKRHQQQSSAPGTPVSSISTSDNKFDSSTYRKNSRASAVAAQQVPPTPPPSVLKEQLQQLKTNANSTELLEDAHDEEERDKYKTVTLNSFRKSFRDRFLQQQREEAAAAQYQPAWFVEVEPQAPAERGRQRERATSKENRPDFLEFANENYRPDSRSPVRDRMSRSKTRSPVKRNETFRVSEQQSADTEPQPAIRIAFRNAVHTPPQSAGGVRIVPVGVAKPMPTSEYYQQRQQATKSQVQPRSPQRTAHGRPQTAPVGTPTAPLRSATNRSGRYQTLVQLNNSHDYNKPSHATRVQLNGHHSSSSVPSNQIPPYHSQLARYSYAVPQQQPQPQTAHRTSLHDSKMPTNATYFGGTIASGAKRQNVPFGAGYYVQQQQSVPQVKTTTTTTTTTMPQHQQGNKSIYYGRHQQQQHPQQNHHHHQQLHQPPQHHHTPSSHSHNSPHPPQKSRFLVSMQRRSRSPIKLPWR